MLRDLKLDVPATPGRLTATTIGGVNGDALLDALGASVSSAGSLSRSG